MTKRFRQEKSSSWQTELDFYTEDAAKKANATERGEYKKAIVKLQRERAFMPQGSQFNKLEAINRKVGRAVKTSRYDDLFEDLMDYMVAEDINTIEDYRQQLEEALSPKPSDKLFKELIKTNNAREFLEQKNIERATPGTAKRISEQFPINKRERIRKVIKERKTVYRVRNQKTGRQELVYKSFFTIKKQKREVYRSALTGRFGTNPKKIMKALR